MIRVSTKDEEFNRAWRRANAALPVEWMERPRQFGERWREAYKCRLVPGGKWPNVEYIFDNDEDYTWFMLKWG